MISPPRHQTVSDVMTSGVHVASPLAPFKLLVRLIEENRVSAIPIVDHTGLPVGIVSESDLLLKERRLELERSRDLLHPQKRRVERAKQLFQGGGDLSLAQVAARAGFSDQSQFSHHFKRVLGVTPGQFSDFARIA